MQCGIQNFSPASPCLAQLEHGKTDSMKLPPPRDGEKRKLNQSDREKKLVALNIVKCR